MMAYRECDDEILRDHFIVPSCGRRPSVRSRTPIYERNQPTKPEMYNIKEVFEDMLDDFVVGMVGAAVARDESLQGQPCTSSEPMRGRAAPQTTGDAAVSAEHLDIEMRLRDIGGERRTWSFGLEVYFPGPQQRTAGACAVEGRKTGRTPVMLLWSPMGITASRIAVPAPRPKNTRQEGW